MSAVTQTITRTIVGINPIGNNVWQIEFNPSQTQITSDVSTSPVIYLSSSTLPVILNPFLNNIGNFNNSDYNAIINNVIPNRLSEWYQQIDYATDQNIPVNFQQLISGKAAPASVQDSNYTSYQYSGIRYWGSKNTTDNFNTASISQSLVVQGYQNDDIGTTTLGYPSVQIDNCLIAEFYTGGGTSIEIMNKYAVFVGDLFQVSTATGDPLVDRDSISVIRPLDDFYFNTVELWASIGEQMQIIQYSTAAKVPQPSTVFAVLDYLPPSTSDYYIWSDFTDKRAQVAAANPFRINFFDNTGVCAKQVSDNADVSRAALLTNISSSIASGNRIFLSIYDEGTFTSLTYGTQEQTLIPLPVEINSVNVASNFITLKTALPSSLLEGCFGDESGVPALNELGMLIFSVGTGTSILFDLPQGNSASGIGNGAIIERYNNRTINEQFNYITRTFGENSTN